MIVVSVIVSVIWIMVARTRTAGREAPLVPTTTVGRIALASLLLVIVVAVAGVAPAVTVPTGVLMIGLASFARWVRHDGGLLLVVPITFGLSILVLPLVFE